VLVRVWWVGMLGVGEWCQVAAVDVMHGRVVRPATQQFSKHPSEVACTLLHQPSTIAAEGSLPQAFITICHNTEWSAILQWRSLQHPRAHPCICSWACAAQPSACHPRLWVGELGHSSWYVTARRAADLPARLLYSKHHCPMPQIIKRARKGFR
jgi:hypothetical protein